MVKYAFYPFKFGILKIGYSTVGITCLQKVDVPSDIHEPSPLTNDVYLQVMSYLNGERQDFDFPFDLVGTVFQMRVWDALCAIPYGETRSYKEIAIAIGNPKASRAVGMANNKNPIGIAIPCHRVIGSNGKLVGYASGLSMKEDLLALEKYTKLCHTQKK